jgi:hypothetical protein
VLPGEHLGEFERKVERGPQQELKDSGRVFGGAGWYGGYCLRAGPNPPAGPAVPALSIKRLRGPLCNHRVLGERITVDRLQEEKAAVRIRGQVCSHSEWVRKEVKKSLGR